MSTTWIQVHRVCLRCDEVQDGFEECFRCLRDLEWAVDAAEVLALVTERIKTSDNGGANDKGYHGHDLRQVR